MSTFSQEILIKVGPILKGNQLLVQEQEENYLLFQSDKLVIIVEYNQNEKSSTLFLGRNKRKIDVIEIDNKTLSQVFKTDLKLSQVPVDIFIGNLERFFQNEGRTLLTGNKKVLKNLESYDQERSDKYTKSIVEKQVLNKANEAWSSKQYQEFIAQIDKIGVDGLSRTYRLKYKIARRKVDEK